MNKSTLTIIPDPKLHVAILLDGNGRWAAARELPRSEGHRAGVEAVRGVVRAAPGLGHRHTHALCIFLEQLGTSRERGDFPSEFARAIPSRRSRSLRQGGGPLVRDRAARSHSALLWWMRSMLPSASRLMAPSSKSGSRSIILRARPFCARLAGCFRVLEISEREFARRLGEVTHGEGPAPDVDLLIRTGGERRLSDFMLWECAYAELLFTPRMWPEFQAADLAEAVEDFQGRERRFGRLPAAAAS